MTSPSLDRGQEEMTMRYDDYDDYSRSSRGRSSGSSRGSSSYSGRDYDRNYRDDHRSYSSRDYDRYDRDYDRGYSSRDHGRDDHRGYSSSRRGTYDDFSDWERTAPNWDDRGSSRGRSSGSSRGSSSRSSRDYDRGYSASRSSGSRNGRPSGSGSRNGSRPSGQKKGQKKRKKNSIQIVPIVLGLVLIILAALIIKSFVGGGSGGDYALSISSKTIVVDETATATVTGLSETETYDIQWSSSDNGVVSVDGDGETCTLTAKSNGTVTITATVNGETVEDTVMVVDVAPGVKDIKFAEEVVEIISGQTYTVDATVIMESEDMTPAKLSWSSADNSVARVSDDGVIEAREVGTTIIKATAGEQTAEIAVTVVPNPDSETHDESQSTGTEPEEGAVLPDDGAGAQNAATGTTGNTGATGNGGQDESTDGNEEGGDQTTTE